MQKSLKFGLHIKLEVIWSSFFGFNATLIIQACDNKNVVDIWMMNFGWRITTRPSWHNDVFWYMYIHIQNRIFYYVHIGQSPAFLSFWLLEQNGRLSKKMNLNKRVSQNEVNKVARNSVNSMKKINAITIETVSERHV